MEFLGQFLGMMLGSGLVSFAVQRYYAKKDRETEQERARKEETQKQIEVGLETIRLLAYYRMSHEIERLLNKGYATSQERKILGDMYANYKAHGWNGDMDERLHKVYKMRTDRPG